MESREGAKSTKCKRSKFCLHATELSEIQYNTLETYLLRLTVFVNGVFVVDIAANS